MATHRAPEARIAALEAQIERIKTRAERAKVRKDPAPLQFRLPVALTFTTHRGWAPRSPRIAFPVRSHRVVYRALFTRGTGVPYRPVPSPWPLQRTRQTGRHMPIGPVMYRTDEQQAPTLNEIRAAFRMLGLSADVPPAPVAWQQQDSSPNEAVIVVRSNSSSPTRLPDGCYA